MPRSQRKRRQRSPLNKKGLLRLAALAAFVAGVVLFCRTQYELPVLMYHRVDVSEKSGTVVSPETFERQMEFLKTHGYHVLALSEVLDILKSRKNFPPNSVAITFDDGTVDNIKNAFPILKKMGFP